MANRIQQREPEQQTDWVAADAFCAGALQTDSGPASFQSGALQGVVYGGMDKLPSSYRHLFEKVGKKDFFSSLPWFENFQRHIVPAHESVAVYGVEPIDYSGTAVGAVPIWRHRSASWYQPCVWQTLANYYTPHFEPIVAQERMQTAIRAFARALWADRRHYAAVDLRCLDSGSPAFPLLAHALSSEGFVVQTYFQFGNWYLNVDGRSFEEYVSGLSSVLRKNIPYQTRRFERSYRVEYKLVTGQDGLDQALRDYEAVYHSSWRTQEAYPGFVRGLADIAIAAGALRLGLLYADGIPVAAQFWLVHGGVASIFKIAYVESYAKYSIGTVLTAYMMRHAIDREKVSVIDYLSGDDGYKKDWMSHRRERWGMMAINPRCVTGLGLVVRHLGGRFLKAWWNKSGGAKNAIPAG